MYDINQIADYFIEKVDENIGDVITNLKLQKLLYFAWAWYLTLYKKELFEDSPESWKYGPVFKKVYQRFKGRSNHAITGEDILFTYGGIEREAQEFLDNIWNEYGQYTAEKLANITHADPAWIQAQDQGYKLPMEKDIIVKYFKEQQDKAQEDQDLSDIYEIENSNLHQDLSASESREFLKSISL